MKPRLAEADIIRALACLSVITVHITAATISLGTASNFFYFSLVFFNRFCISAVPVFIFISGLVMYYRYENEPITYLPFIKKRFNATYIPYLEWSFLYYALFLISGVYTFSVSFLFKNIFLATMIYHLYFVAIIVQLYLIFPFLKKCFELFSANLILFLTFLITVLFFYFSKYGWQMGLPSYFFDRIIFAYIFFFTLGCYLAKEHNRLTATKLKTSSIFFLLIVESLVKTFVFSYMYTHTTVLNNYYNYIWLIFSTFDILIFTLSALRLAPHLNSFTKKIIANLGRDSYYIYLCHPLFLIIAQKTVSYLHLISTPIIFFIYAFITFGGSIFFSHLYSSFKKYYKKINSSS